VTAPLEPEREGSALSAHAPRRSLGAAAALGTVVAIASSFVPLSYDEGNWLAVVRRVAGGDSLYRDISDNKSPMLFGLVRAVDLLPGRYEIGRAIYLGIAAALLAWLSMRFLSIAGFDERSALLLGVAFGLAAAMQAVLVVNFELPAALLIVAGISLVATGSDIAGGIVAGLAVTFDLRASVLLIGLILAAFGAGGQKRAIRTALAAALPAIGWSAVVLLNADLRYSLVELNVATRGGARAWRPGMQLTSFARTMIFPLVAVAAITARSPGARRRFAVAGIVLTLAGLAAAVASIQPFDKYWTLLIPGLVAYAASRVPRVVRDRAKLVGLLCIALAPAAVYAATSSSDEAAIVGRYERAAPDVERFLGKRGLFVRFDSQPFIGTFLPERDLTPAAVLDFLIAPTSREERNLAAVDAAITQATAIVDDGALEIPANAILPSYRALRAVFAERLGEFPCVEKTNGLTIHLRAQRCT